MPLKLWLSILLILGVTVLTIVLSLFCTSYPFLDIGQILIFAITLVFVVIYAWDTHRIANATEEKWEQELQPKIQYEMKVNPNEEQSRRTLFGLINTTDYLIEARVNCNFRIYGESVTLPGAYNGTEDWVLFPHQISAGHFSIDAVLDRRDKTREEMIRERTESNTKEQLTMDLEISFRSETGRERNYPPRRHHFDFERWVWIPEITRPE